MCSQSVLNEITGKVVQAARVSLGNKLDKVILYGSYARGDNDNESDIDIMVLADIPLEHRGEERDRIRELLGYIDLDYDIVLSLNVTDCATFNRYTDDLPFYMNVLRDGVVLSA
ncbi:MAG: nucleotidyltransferase domain-containing protein [Oscillospiraceae bacterium]|nr:nucleotidyltransferase domain-containing protein [Oscillospiraceae bacterium]